MVNALYASNNCLDNTLYEIAGKKARSMFRYTHCKQETQIFDPVCLACCLTQEQPAPETRISIWRTRVTVHLTHTNTVKWVLTISPPLLVTRVLVPNS
jgi:hypothetical protein